MSARTRVMCVRGYDPRNLATDSLFTYVGRTVPRRDHFWTGSVNALVEQLRAEPEKLLTGAEAVTCYRVYLENHPALTEQLPTLRGRTLGCWCADWTPGDPSLGGGFVTPAFSCHAAVLALKADGRQEDLDDYLETLLRRAQSCLTM